MATYERKQLIDYTLGDKDIDLYSRVSSVLDDKLSLSEWPIYGSARLGVLDLNGKGELYNNGTDMWTKPLSHTKAGYREYEITNHLGNVLATISDVKFGIDNPVDGTIDYYEPKLFSRQDYYPFGMLMAGRNDAKKEYRFGFNGKENDNEVKGKGNWQDYGMRMYDSRLCRFPSFDPITRKFPELTPYQFGTNNPIQNIDLDGLEGKPSNYQTNDKGYLTQSTEAQDNLGNHALPAPVKPSNTSEPFMKIKVTGGFQIAFQLGKVGGEVNLGSKTLLEYDINGNADEKNVLRSPWRSDPSKHVDETTQGFGFNIGIFGANVVQSKVNWESKEFSPKYAGMSYKVPYGKITQSGGLYIGNDLINVGASVNKTVITKRTNGDIRMMILGKAYGIESSLDYKMTIHKRRTLKIAAGFGIEID